MENNDDLLHDLPVTVMGLGLHGGGLAAAQYLSDRGARVTVTDLRSERELAATVARLPGTIRLVLGEHREEDFNTAALVIKNPAVPRTSRFLRSARAVTTDIALFLAEWDRTVPDRGSLVAVTGTKGKSSTAAAAAALLEEEYPGTKLGGNITISPLGFLDRLGPGDPVVLELSSFQLGDLAFCRRFNGTTGGQQLETALHPVVPADVAIVTSIFTDHQDYYRSMEAYVEDKAEILRSIVPGGLGLLGCGPEWRRPFLDAASHLSAVEIRTITEEEPGVLPASTAVAGRHMRRNLFMAALAAQHLGVPADRISARAATFTGVPHRLERLGSRENITIVNDTAATIPEAALAATEALPAPTVLIAGGSDKGLDTAPLVSAGRRVTEAGGAVVLLAGSATERLLPAMRIAGVPVTGPENSLRTAFLRSLEAARARATPTTPATILLSPGCASFGMFRNEFDRGDQFRELARAFIATGGVPD